MTEEWHGWTTFREVDDLRSLGWKPGVYAIRLFNGDERKPLSIQRFVGTDRQGILMIGVSKNLNRRLVQFYNSCYKGQHSHSEGERLCRFRVSSHFEELVYPESSIQFNNKWAPDIEEAKREEEILLRTYFHKFGELPPLNSNIGNRHLRRSERDLDWETLW